MARVASAKRRSAPARLLRTIAVPATLAGLVLAHSLPSRAEECPTPPPVVDFAAHSFYTDSSGSIIDPVRLQALQDAIRPVRNFIYEVARRSDAAILSGDAAAAACAARLLSLWAKAGALSAPATANEQVYEKTDFIFALAVAAMKLAHAAVPPAPEAIEWLDQLAQQNIAEFPHFHPLFSNLYDWTGAMAATVSALADDPALRSYAEAVLAAASAHIRPDGVVPSELARGKRAFIYHVRDFNAIAVMELLMRRCGDASCLGAADARLYRLIAANVAGDHSLERLTGIKQEEESDEKWMIIFCAMSESSAAVKASPHCHGAVTADVNLGGDWRAFVGSLRR